LVSTTIIIFIWSACCFFLSYHLYVTFSTVFYRMTIIVFFYSMVIFCFDQYVLLSI
jgi:hypothetical protein